MANGGQILEADLKSPKAVAEQAGLYFPSRQDGQTRCL
jgi:hypothetical protein